MTFPAATIAPEPESRMTRHAWAAIVFALVVCLLGLGRNGFGGYHPTITTIAASVIFLGLFAALKISRTRM